MTTTDQDLADWGSYLSSVDLEAPSSRSARMASQTAPVSSSRSDGASSRPVPGSRVAKKTPPVKKAVPAKKAAPAAPPRTENPDVIDPGDPPRPTFGRTRGEGETEYYYNGRTQARAHAEQGYIRTSPQTYDGKQTMWFGYRGPGAEPKAVPFRPHASDRLDGRDHAFLSMSRQFDMHSAYEVPDMNKRSDLEDYHTGQGHLFKSSEARPWKIEELYSNKGSWPHVNALLGMAGEHSMRTSGQVPKSDSNLSSHSRRMVSKLADKGIIDPPELNLSDNGIDWEDGAHRAKRRVDDLLEGYPTEPVRVSNSEAAKGSNVYRQTIRGANATPKPRYTEAELAGSDRQPLVASRTKAGRIDEFLHQERLKDKSEAKSQAPETNIHQLRMFE